MSSRNPARSLARHPARSPLSREGGISLPSGYIFRTGQDGIDTIGLSASALLAALPPHHRSIYFTDPSDPGTKKSDADIITAIQASAFLNDGGELVGSLAKGYAQYADLTATATLDKAYRYFRVTRPAAYASDIKSCVCAVDGTLSTMAGPTHVYSAAAGQVVSEPWVVQSSAIAPVSSYGYGARVALTNLFGLSDSPAAPRTKTLTAQKYCLQVKTGSATCSYGTATPSSPLQFTATAGDTTFTPTGVDDWCLTASGGYVFMPLPYGQSTVSTVGTAAGNGVSVPLSGSAEATALKQCLEGPLGNNASGTVVVLLRMGASSADIPVDSAKRPILSVANNADDLLLVRDSAGTKQIVRSYDGTSNPSINGTWSRGEYHLKVVEFNGTKFRVGSQRYNANGTAIDADIVWSSATLAGATNFDGSYNPLTHLRWMLDSTMPNNIKCHWIGNQHSLGNTEIIRRTRKYGKF